MGKLELGLRLSFSFCAQPISKLENKLGSISSALFENEAKTKTKSVVSDIVNFLSMDKLKL